MTLAEFKAWLEGFKEAMGDAPTPEQWQKVLAKMETVREASLLPPTGNAYPTVFTQPRFGEVTAGSTSALVATMTN